MKNLMKISIIGIVTGFFNGFFGSGGGTIVVPAMQKFCGISTHKSHATAIGIILPLSIISACIYVKGAEISSEWYSVLLISAGGVLGGLIGAKFLSKISTKWLHRLFGACMVLAGLRMIF